MVKVTQVFLQCSTSLYLILHYYGSTSPHMIYITLPWLYLTLHYSTIALLHSASFHIILPWLYLTLLDSILLYFDFTLLEPTLLHHDSTLVYHGSTSLYLNLHHSTLLILILLDSTLLYHALLNSTLLYNTLLWHYFTLLDPALHYHGSTSLYLILHHSNMVLLHST